MYEIEARVTEQHGKYQCSFEAWDSAPTEKFRIISAWETDISPRGELGDEHLEILEVLRLVCTRIAEKYDRPLL